MPAVNSESNYHPSTTWDFLFYSIFNQPRQAVQHKNKKYSWANQNKTGNQSKNKKHSDQTEKAYAKQDQAEKHCKES